MDEIHCQYLVAAYLTKQRGQLASADRLTASLWQLWQASDTTLSHAQFVARAAGQQYAIFLINKHGESWVKG